MLLKHSWAEGRLGRKQNDTFTKTQLDTNEGLAYNQQIYRKLHHSYGKTFRKFDIDRNDDTKLNIHIDNNAYNTLLRNKEKDTYDNMDAGRMSTSDLLISPMRSQKKSANVKNNNYRPLGGYSSYSNESYTWRPRHSTTSPKARKKREQFYRSQRSEKFSAINVHKNPTTLNNITSTTNKSVNTSNNNNNDGNSILRTKMISSPVKVVLQSSIHSNKQRNNDGISTINDDITITTNNNFSSSKTKSSFLLASRLEKPPNLINPADVHNYALQSKVKALEKQLEASQRYIKELKASEIDDTLEIDHLGLSNTTFEPTPATEFHGGKTGIYGKLWDHAGYTKTFKYATCWEAGSPRHQFLRRTSLASPNHKIVSVLQKEEGLDETIDDPGALKRPRFSLHESHELLRDLKDLRTLALFRNSTELFQKHYVYPSHHGNRSDLTMTLSPFLLMKVFEYLNIGELREMACTEKRMVLWTSCPVLWGRQAYDLTLILETIVDCIQRTEESYLTYRQGKKALSLVTNECIKEVARVPRPERIVRDVITALGLLLYGSTDPFSQIRTSMDPPVQMPLVSWPACQRMLSKKNFLRKLLKHNPANFKMKRLKRLRPYISHDHLKVEIVKKHNSAFSKIANWMHTSSVYCIRQRRLDRLGSKIRDKWEIGKAVLKESKHRQKIWQNVEDGWLDGLYAYNTLI